MFDIELDYFFTILFLLVFTMTQFFKLGGAFSYLRDRNRNEDISKRHKVTDILIVIWFTKPFSHRAERFWSDLEEAALERH